VAAAVVIVVLEGSYRVWAVTDADRKAAIESARAKSDEPSRALVKSRKITDNGRKIVGMKKCGQF